MRIFSLVPEVEDLPPRRRRWGQSYPVVEAMELDKAVDISAALRLGVYVLRREGRVVFVGKSRCPLLHIAAHRQFSRGYGKSWFPIKGITFDAVEVILAHPDRIDALVRGLIELYLPVHNSATEAPAGSVSVSPPQSRQSDPATTLRRL